MRFVKPEIYFIGETKANQSEIDRYLADTDNSAWSTDAPSDSEKLMEFYGRLCYNAFVPFNNKNVSKVREGNDIYLKNIISSAHGSILEHATLNFVFHNISRVFSHEIVRHRQGTAISQESLRYVRLDNIKVWIPNLIASSLHVQEAMEITISFIEKQIKNVFSFLDMTLGLDKPGNFELKKKWTSAVRRMAPIGLATTIGWSVNFRALRFILEQRTHPSAEEEIRHVFGRLGRMVLDKYPNAFQGYEIEEVDGEPWFKPIEMRKV